MFETPILFLVFNRPDTTALVFERIKAIKPRQLFIAADGARIDTINELELCEKTREIIHDINWDCEVKTLFRTKNLGCGKAVSEAISWFFEHVEQGIILEDDCLPHLTFFNYCETLLNVYKNDLSVFHIGGTNFQFGRQRGNGSYYFSKYPHVWGWATWKRAWEGYDIKMSDYPKAKSTLKIEPYWQDIFATMYQYPIDTWDHQWFFHVVKQNGKAIIPNQNLVVNIGFRPDATHTTSCPNWLKKHSINHAGLSEIQHPTRKDCDKKADNYTFKTHYNEGFSLKNTIRNAIRNTIKIIMKASAFSSRKDRIALIRTDNIGDYILFRNLLPFIKNSVKYKDKKIILIGNSVWKELAEHFDTEFIDVFFWINMARFESDKIYRFKILWQLNQFKIVELINTVHSRTLKINVLVELVNAQLKTTCAGDSINLDNMLQLKSDKLFNEIVPSLSNFNFEFFRNKVFVEHLIDEKIELSKPHFKGIKKEIKPLQILIFPSAQSVQRRWDTHHFATLIQLIADRLPQFEFVILGSKEDVYLGENILKKCNKKMIINNLCGKTSLVELVGIISESRLLISNETSAVHIAAAVETPTICIANGERINRFSPYPLSITSLITYFFPITDFYKKENAEYLTHKYQHASDLDINQIQPEMILPTIISILTSENQFK
jgi:ADP-heptose:LPS heptosyltransferase